MAKKTKKRQAAESRPANEFKPGNRWRFRPGVSGNPEGRGVENRESWRDFLNELDSPNTPKTRLRRLMELAYRRGCQGSFKHLELCIDRGFGRPTVHTENVNVNANLADVISEARKRAAEAKTFCAPTAKQLPASIETAPELPKAPATRPAQRVLDTEVDDGQPKNVMEALNRSTRESRCLSDDPQHSSWWRPN